MRHTIGDVLTALRQTIYPDDLAGFKDDLTTFAIPAWFYFNLEHSHAYHLPAKREAIFLHFFGLPATTTLADLQAAKDLPAAINAALTAHDQEYAWYFRRETLPWPDSQQVAQHFQAPKKDPTANFREADLLRFLRQELAKTVPQLADYFNLPPLIYWQIETGQRPLTADMVGWIKALLGVKDLRDLTHAKELKFTLPPLPPDLTLVD